MVGLECIHQFAGRGVAGASWGRSGLEGEQDRSITTGLPRSQ